MRKVRTWLCPGLPRSCSTRAVCTEIMNQSGIPASCGQLKGRGAMPAMGHVPNSCSSSKLVLRSWMLPSLASPVRRRWRPNAGDRSISLLGFRARRCSFSGTVAEPCAWESRCCFDSLRRIVSSEFHLLNKSVGTRPLNEHVMHFVDLCLPLPMLIGSGHCEPSYSCHSSWLFCELELLCDRDRRVADAVALSRSSDNGSSSSSSDRKSSGLSRRHLLNPGYHTTAVGCRHIRCLFRQPQMKA